MNTFQLNCFLMVAETLNFARAAEHLHVTQPAVTQQIHSLEKELNVKLFKRTTRTVKLTMEGLLFLNDAHHIVALSERAIKRFESPYNQTLQFLSLGCYSYTQLTSLGPILQKMLKQYPNLHPRLQVAPYHHLYRLLDENDLDAVIGFRNPQAKRPSAAYQELIKVPMACICASTHPFAKLPSVSLQALKAEKLVLFDPGKLQSEVTQVLAQLMSGRDSSEFYFCESEEAVLVLVQAGYGVTVLPALCVPASFSLACIPLEDAEWASFGISYQSVEGNAPLKSFIQLMKETV